MIKKYIKTVITLIICFISFPLIVSADTGPKPSIDITIKNLETSNYIIDLLVYDKDGEGYKSEANYNGNELTEEQIEKLHNLNYDGWISESTRWGYYLLFTDCKGNKEHSHHFSYFGTPERYKVLIINEENDEIKISEEIVRDTFNSKITIDYTTMKPTIDNNNNQSNTYMKIIICLLITICVELLLAVILKVGNYKTIVITNTITNLGLQLALILLSNQYMKIFIIGEILVIASELLTYLITFKNISKNKTILYTLIANTVTILISLLLYKL